MKRYSYNRVQDTSRRQKAQQAIKGTNKNVRTFAILTAENPNAEELSRQENKELNNQLEELLKLEKHLYFKIKGQYNYNAENAYIIYNLALQDAVNLSDEFEQKAFIFFTMVEDGYIADYYERVDADSPYELIETKDKYVDASDAADMWSQISRDFKFRIPFFDHALYIDERIEKLNRIGCDTETRLERLARGTGSGSYTYASRWHLWHRPLDE